MRCKHHPEIRTDELCDLCAEPICNDCITEVHETRHCPACYMRVSEMPDTGPTVCHEAKRAFGFSIASLFCFGQVFGLFAIYKGFKARKQIQLDSTIIGIKLANAAIFIGAIGFCIWLYGSIILVPNASDFLRDDALREAQKQAQASARAAGAPEGFLETKWLMTLNEVRQVRPNIQPGLQATEIEGKMEYIELIEMFGRSVVISYVFDEDILMMVYITFPAPSSREEYDAAHKEIEAKYGPLTEPKQGGDDRLESSRQIGRIAISHDLYERQGILVQQLMIYRTSAP